MLNNEQIVKVIDCVLLFGTPYTRSRVDEKLFIGHLYAGWRWGRIKIERVPDGTVYLIMPARDESDPFLEDTWYTIYASYRPNEPWQVKGLTAATQIVLRGW